MKKIRLKPDAPLHNYTEVAVMDFPSGEVGEERQRCKITVEFAEADVKQLQKQGLDFDGAMQHYRNFIYEVIKYHLAQDWECIGGMDEVMATIEEKVKQYY